MCDDPHAVEVPPLQLNVIPLNTVGAAQVHKRIDILGVVEDVGDLRQVAAQTASEPQERRDIRIVDSSNTKLQLTLWGDNAKNFNVSHGDHPVMAIKNALVRHYNNCYYLNTNDTTRFELNPSGSRAAGLGTWYSLIRPAEHT
ncbi:hypothetical protein QR680_011410 [Steinernema hermaphroditum]|uniref:Replication protein A OB domain-containing protein n=1 Tax=Steinernema hermaphroditum TaxID=289476 RepID=A0AA39ITQ2_9BILA|nr:hypothetical protein QR680_011410 [Steinernema hermaphroditum]